MPSASNFKSFIEKADRLFRKKSTFLVFIFFIGLSIIFTFPSILHLNTKIIGDGGDNYLYFGYQNIFASQVKAGQIPFSFSTMVRFPFGFPFYRAYDTFVGVVLGGLVSIFINPITAYNLSVLFLLSLSAFFSYVLFRYISKKELVGIAGGIIYGFSFYGLGRSNGHIGLLFTAGFPLLFYSLMRIHDSPSKKNILYLCSSVLLIAIASFQYLLLMFVSLLIGIPVLFLFFPNEGKRLLVNLFKSLNRAWVFVIPFILFFLVVTGPIIFSYLSGSFVHTDRSAAFKEYSPSLSEYVLPNKYLGMLANTVTDKINTNPSSIERISYIGIVEIILFGLFLMLYRKNNQIKKMLLFLFAVPFFLSLGFYNSDFNIVLPYSYLFKYFPFSSIPETARFIVLYLIPFTIGIILLMSTIRSRFVIYFVLILLVFERISFSTRLSSLPYAKEYINKVRSLGNAGVLDIPISYENTYQNTLPSYYRRSIVGGTFHWSADDMNTRQFTQNVVAKNLICSNEDINYSSDSAAFISYLEKNSIDTIVVHKNDLEDHAKFYFPECASARIQTSLLLPQLFNPNVSNNTQVMSLFFPTISGIGDTVSFPSDGNFSIEGFHVYPGDWMPLHMFVNEKEINISQNWVDREGGNITQDVKIQMKVKQGMKLTFKFDKNNNSDYSFIKMWYRFESTGTSSAALSPIQKIYEDEDAAVFKL